MSDRYKLLEDVGLEVIPLLEGMTRPKGGSSSEWVRADDVLALLETALSVYGYVGEHGSTWTQHTPGTFIQENINRTALLINIKPIEKPLTKADLIAAMRDCCLADWADRIEKMKGPIE